MNEFIEKAKGLIEGIKEVLNAELLSEKITIIQFGLTISENVGFTVLGKKDDDTKSLFIPINNLDEEFSTERMVNIISLTFAKSGAYCQ